MKQLKWTTVVFLALMPLFFGQGLIFAQELPTLLPTLIPPLTPPANVTAIPSATPTLTATYRPTSTPYPTATYSPSLTTAIANGECLQSFDTFAYQSPLHTYFDPETLLPSTWIVQSTHPPHQIPDYHESLFPMSVQVSRVVDGLQELWFTGSIWPVHYSKNPFERAIITLYQPELKKWEFISPDVANTSLTVINLFSSSDGGMWGQVSWKSGETYSDFKEYPVLSRFNELTRRFELVEGAPKVRLTEESQLNNLINSAFDNTRIVPDGHDGFWIFIQYDGLYHYDFNAGTSEKRADYLGDFIGRTALSVDESLYFTKIGGTERPTTPTAYLSLRDGVLFQFIPETGETIAVDTPEGWPMFAGLLVDHTGRLWLGSVGYRDVDGTWHLIHPHPEEYFDVAESGRMSYVWAMPYPVLEDSNGMIWFEKFLDTSGWGEGIAWYNAETGEGCLVTNAPKNIVESADKHLWMMIDGILYKYALNP